MHHETGGEVGRVDRAAGGALTGLRFGRVEQRGGVVVAADGVGGGQDPKDFAQHAAVAPELAAG